MSMLITFQQTNRLQTAKEVNKYAFKQMLCILILQYHIPWKTARGPSPNIK